MSFSESCVAGLFPSHVLCTKEIISFATVSFNLAVFNEFSYGSISSPMK